MFAHSGGVLFGSEVGSRQPLCKTAPVDTEIADWREQLSGCDKDLAQDLIRIITVFSERVDGRSTHAIKKQGDA